MVGYIYCHDLAQKPRQKERRRLKANDERIYLFW